MPIFGSLWKPHAEPNDYGSGPAKSLGQLQGLRRSFAEWREHELHHCSPGWLHAHPAAATVSVGVRNDRETAPRGRFVHLDFPLGLRPAGSARGLDLHLRLITLTFGEPLDPALKKRQPGLKPSAGEV